MRDYCHKRYQNDSGYRAAAILKASARVQQRRQDPSYRAREAELQGWLDQLAEPNAKTK